MEVSRAVREYDVHNISLAFLFSSYHSTSYAIQDLLMLFQTNLELFLVIVDAHYMYIFMYKVRELALFT